MSDGALDVARRLALMEAAAQSGALAVQLAPMKRLNFASPAQLRAMLIEMRDAARPLRVRFRLAWPAGGAAQITFVSVPEAVSAALAGLGEIVDDGLNRVALAAPPRAKPRRSWLGGMTGWLTR